MKEIEQAMTELLVRSRKAGLEISRDMSLQMLADISQREKAKAKMAQLNDDAGARLTESAEQLAKLQKQYDSIQERLMAQRREANEEHKRGLDTIEALNARVRETEKEVEALQERLAAALERGKTKTGDGKGAPYVQVEDDVLRSYLPKLASNSRVAVSREIVNSGKLDARRDVGSVEARLAALIAKQEGALGVVRAMLDGPAAEAAGAADALGSEEKYRRTAEAYSAVARESSVPRSMDMLSTGGFLLPESLIGPLYRAQPAVDPGLIDDMNAYDESREKMTSVSAQMTASDPTWASGAKGECMAELLLAVLYNLKTSLIPQANWGGADVALHDDDFIASLPRPPPSPPAAPESSAAGAAHPSTSAAGAADPANAAAGLKAGNNEPALIHERMTVADVEIKSSGLKIAVDRGKPRARVQIKRVKTKMSTVVVVPMHHRAGLDFWARPTASLTLSSKSNSNSVGCCYLRVVENGNTDAALIAVLRGMPRNGWRHLGAYRRPGQEKSLLWWNGWSPDSPPLWPLLEPRWQRPVQTPIGGGPPCELPLLPPAANDVLRPAREAAQRWWAVANGSSFVRVAAMHDVPAGLPGGALYLRFAAAHTAVCDKSISIAFHGTAEKNVDVIAAEGLDPDLRRGAIAGSGDYFMQRLDKVLRYSEGARRILIFALLTDSSGLTYEGRHMYVINKSAHQVRHRLLLTGWCTHLAARPRATLVREHPTALP